MMIIEFSTAIFKFPFVPIFFQPIIHFCLIMNDTFYAFSDISSESASTNASTVRNTTSLSFCFNLRTLADILCICPSPSMTSISPTSSLALVPNACASRRNTSMDISLCPPSIRLTVFRLTSAISASFSCDQ